jgi:hypothetical protein
MAMTLAGVSVDHGFVRPAGLPWPSARRMTTELTGDQHELYEIFDLAKWALRS